MLTSTVGGNAQRYENSGCMLQKTYRSDLLEFDRLLGLDEWHGDAGDLDTGKASG